MIKYILLMALTSQFATAQEAKAHQNYLAKTKQVSENVWIGPQPTEADFKELADEKISVLINNRTQAEVEQLGFNEVEVATRNNMNYDLLEIGQGHAYSPIKLIEFNDLMTANADKKILLHCRSGNRSSQLYTAWLIEYQDKSPAEALKIIGSEETELNDSVRALLGQ